MEDPAILRMNLDHFRRLLEIEADPAKRQMIKADPGNGSEAAAISIPVRGTVVQRLQRVVAQMMASTRTRAGGCHGHASPAKPMPPGQKPGFLAQRDLREPYLAVFHELRERLTAVTKYLASALQRSEIESIPAVMPLGQPEI